MTEILRKIGRRKEEKKKEITREKEKESEREGRERGSKGEKRKKIQILMRNRKQWDKYEYDFNKFS